jgi:hypothetical protein
LCSLDTEENLLTVFGITSFSLKPLANFRDEFNFFRNGDLLEVGDLHSKSVFIFLAEQT